MTTAPDFKPALDFLSGLERNNNKTWFEAHREEYQAARQEFEQFVDELIRGVNKFDELGSLSAKECVFRINRDVRFSKDKSPYKATLSAIIAPGGKGGMSRAGAGAGGSTSGHHGYYVQIGPHDESLLAGGLYAPLPAELAKFRQAIARDAKPFKRITGGKSFVEYFGEISGARLLTAPQGYPRDHPEIALLKLKEIVATHHLPDEMVCAPGLTAHTLKVFKAMKPFLDYLKDATQ